MNVITDVMSQGVLIDVTQAAAGVAGILHLAKVKPFVAPHVPLRNSVVGDFTFSIDANLVGQTIVWGGAYREPAGGVVIDGGAQLFQLADAAHACICYGVVVTDSTGAVLLFAEVFDTPIQLADVLDGFLYSPQYKSGAGDQGSGTIIR